MPRRMPMNKTTARVIVAYQCNRSCPGCCNTHGNAVRKIEGIQELLKYKEIIITGGEPMLMPTELNEFITRLKGINDYKGKIFLYTALFDALNERHRKVLSRVDGITYTIHSEASDNDIKLLKWLSCLSILGSAGFSSRLIIDNRIYDRYDFSNIDLTNWDVIRKLQWKDHCEPAPNEELVEFLL